MYCKSPKIFHQTSFAFKRCIALWSFCCHWFFLEFSMLGNRTNPWKCLISHACRQLSTMFQLALGTLWTPLSSPANGLTRKIISSCYCMYSYQRLACWVHAWFIVSTHFPEAITSATNIKLMMGKSIRFSSSFLFASFAKGFSYFVFQV